MILLRSELPPTEVHQSTHGDVLVYPRRKAKPPKRNQLQQGEGSPGTGIDRCNKITVADWINA